MTIQYKKVCEGCNGMGVIPHDGLCKVCDGGGTVDASAGDITFTEACIYTAIFFVALIALGNVIELILRYFGT